MELEKVGKAKNDFILMLIIMLLIGIGLTMLFSATYPFAQRLSKSPLYFLLRQLVWVVLGSAIGFLLAYIPMDLIRKAVPFVLFSSLVLLVLPFLPGIGTPPEMSTAHRWIYILGQSFQPSEFAKLALIVYLSHILSKKKDRLDKLNVLIPPVIIVFLFIFIIYLQDDFSTAFLIFIIAASLFYIANVKLSYYVLFMFMVLLLGVLLLLTKEYWVKKLLVFFNLDTDPTGTAYQIIQGKNALINGGLWGRGLGRGIKKLGILPEAYSDYIFAVIGEETGFFGVIFVIGLFGAFAFRGYSIALKTADPFKYYLAFGITTSIVLQAFLNMGMVTQLVPATGIPLPFFSLGGSSFFVCLLLGGLLLNISRNIKDKGGMAYE
ncbi:MAG: putative lipid II flippase FtsW [Spirochaetales bacterium]|nr:putative lipid II flippase FtsW [Spirochaetales bacterium]